MDNSQLKRATWRSAATSGLKKLGQIAPGLGFGALSMQAVEAARKKNRGNRDEEAKQDDPEQGQSEKQDESGKSGSSKERGANDEEKTNASSKRDDSRDEQRGRDKNSDGSNDGSANDGARGESKRQAARQQEADSGDSGKARRSDGKSDSKNEDEQGQGSGDGQRRSHDLEQRNGNQPDDVPEDEPTDTPPPVSTNPNVSITDVPSLDDAELLVEANPDVIASVSSRGGFAFARSGDVTVVSGPDGPTIIRTGAVDTGTDTAPPVDEEPLDDGGNNGDTDFVS